MRNRGHMCASCIGSDEAHHKKHLEICEQLRLVYEINNEDPLLLPTVDGPRDQREDGNDHDDTRPPDTNDGSRSSCADRLSVTKKQRKDAKKLTKAASRPKVIMHDEIEYIGSILHLPPRAIGIEGPDNIDEVEEMEKHLRYNANVYTTGIKRSVLTSFANIRDADLDFEQEMDRILNHLKVTDLMKRNTKNRGLRGKSLKTFENLVVNLKLKIVEDLVIVKRDQMETRMRRAGYLRYANRTSFSVVEDRYTAKDWKTGERIVPPETEATTQTVVVTNFIHNTFTKGDWNENTPVFTDGEPDLRHLRCSHKKAGSDGKVEDVSPISTSPVLKQVKLKPSQPRLTLSIVTNSLEPSIPQPVHALRSSLKSLPPFSPRTPQWMVVSQHPRENAWFKTPGLPERVQLTRVSPHTRLAEQEIIGPPALQKTVNKMVQLTVQPVSGAPEVHPVEEAFKHSPTKKLHEVIKDSEHSPVSQKKVKKKAREAKRKEKKQAAQQVEAIELLEGGDNDEVEEADQQMAAQIPSINNYKHVCILSPSISHLRNFEELLTSVVETTEEDFYSKDSTTATKTTFQFPLPPTPPLSIQDFPISSLSVSLDFTAMAPSPPPVVTKNNKQVH